MSGGLRRAFERAKSEGRLAFVPYVMAGDPDLLRPRPSSMR